MGGRYSVEVIEEGGTVAVHPDAPGRHVVIDFKLTVLPVFIVQIGRHVPPRVFAHRPYCRLAAVVLATPRRPSPLGIR